MVPSCHGGNTTPELLTRNLEHFEFLCAQLQRLPSPADWPDRPWA